MRTNPTHTIPSLSGTFGIPARLAHNPKMPKEPSSPSRSNTETERCNKMIINTLMNKGQLVTSCIVHLADSANIKGVTHNKRCSGLTGLCFESPNDTIHVTVSGNGRTAYNQEHMRKYLYIAFSILINCSVFGQVDSQTDSVSFDKITCRFKETKGWNIFSGELKDSIDTTFLYQTKDFNVSISENPIAFKTFHSVIKNPYFTDDFGDYDNNYVNYPVSYSVIYDNRLLSLFRNGKFVCHRLSNFERDLDFETKLNTRKFKYHWIINDKLGAISGNSIFIWNGTDWISNKTDFPLKSQPKLFEDSDFVVFGDCHGEWGGTVYFFDKNNGETYFTESTCANSVLKKGDSYLVLAHLGHMTGSTEIKEVKDPRKLTQAKQAEINKTKNGQALGYTDSSKAYETILDYWGIQLFSTFSYKDRQLYMVHLNEMTFLAEIVGNDIQIVNPLFDNEIYTHDPVTNKYENYTLMNLDHYGTARDKEISVIIIDGERLIKLDWNENHSR